MQQRRDEILAKKAKLAELKRQREVRAKEVSASRQSIGNSGDVGIILLSLGLLRANNFSLYLLLPAELRTEER